VPHKSNVLFVGQVLDRPDLMLRTRKKCLKLLYKTCGRLAILPKALNIDIYYDRTSLPLSRGGFADVWKGIYDGRDVAVKSLRIFVKGDLQKVINVSSCCRVWRLTHRRVVETFCREVITWKTLRHPNILPLIGAKLSKNEFTMISEWMINGNINDFIQAHPNVNRVKLVGFALEIPSFSRC
jgi:hypothetical protein